jgi:hypothetical protein
MRGASGWILIGSLAAAVVAVLAWQRGELTALAAEAAAARAQHEEWSRVREERRRREAEVPSAAETEKLRRERELAAKVRTAVTGLRQRAESAERVAAQSRATGGRFDVGATVPGREWRNAGRATPAAALETVLWAAAGGDVDAMAECVVFDGAAVNAARALHARLGPELRAQCPTPEKLVAFLTVKEVPTGTAEVRQWTLPADGHGFARLLLTAADGTPKEVDLRFQRTDADWKVLVTEAALEKLGQALARGADGREPIDPAK